MKRREGTHPVTVEVPWVVMEPESGSAGRPLIVLLHGYSKSADAYARLPRRIGEEFNYLVPQGPYKFKRPDGSAGFGWMMSTDGEHDAEGRDRSVEMVESLIEATAKQLDASEIFILGFSQGSFLAWYLGLRNMDRYRGVICQGSWLNEEIARPYLESGLGGGRFFLQHGSEDLAVVPERGRVLAEALAAAGADVDWKAYPVGHELTSAILADVGTWVQVGAVEAAERVASTPSGA